MNLSLRLTFTEAPQKKGPPSTPLDGPFVSRHATRFAARAGDDNVAAGALVARSPVPPIPAPTPPVPDPGGVGSDGHACNFKSARRRARSLKFRGWSVIGPPTFVLTAGANAPVLSAPAIVAEENLGGVISNRHKAIDMPRCCGAIEPRRSAVAGAIAPGVVGRQSPNRDRNVSIRSRGRQRSISSPERVLADHRNRLERPP